jgi:hypothetical protein
LPRRAPEQVLNGAAEPRAGRSRHVPSRGLDSREIAAQANIVNVMALRECGDSRPDRVVAETVEQLFASRCRAAPRRQPGSTLTREDPGSPARLAGEDLDQRGCGDRGAIVAQRKAGRYPPTTGSATDVDANR